MIQFIKEMQQKTGRQIILITHKQEFVDAVPNPIILNPVNNQKRVVKEIKEDKPKKRRGRPKKNVKEN